MRFVTTTTPPSARTTVRRLPERSSYDQALVHAILDEGLVAHVGLATDDGPVVIPMLYGRDGDRLLLHGSPASRLLRGGAKGAQMCVTVTLVDGLVLARSAFHHSMNYRSVVVFGLAQPVDDLDERRAALDVLVEHIVPGPHSRRPRAERQGAAGHAGAGAAARRVLGQGARPAAPSTRTRTWTCRCGPASSR